MSALGISIDLKNRLAEVVMNALVPCDLGDGIEVIHDVEAVEIEMDCAVDDDAEPDAGDTLVDIPMFETTQFVRESAPYERIEIQIDPGAFRRATIAEARHCTAEVHRS